LSKLLPESASIVEGRAGDAFIGVNPQGLRR
jgi:hypothetical protein